jgi:pSer/pThr/pTyr-binding forkhead associated (FHA) protein
MSTPRLKFNGKDITLDDRIVTCGRTPDNVIAFTDEAIVSRYLAEI